MTRKIKVVTVLATLTLLFGGPCGCQTDINLGLGGKLFYPDQVGEKKVGDPRKLMFERSDNDERSTSGGEVRPVGFQGMRGEK